MTPVDWAVTPEKIAAAIARIVELAKPKKVIIFGSAARGETKRDSDLDLLVVASGEVASPRRESGRIRKMLGDILMPMDIIVVAENRFDELASRPGLIYGEALRTGKVVYES